MYSKQDIELIKKKVDLVDFLESRGINMARRGNNYVGLCPVHSEKSPSFNVRPLQQSFHCFGCGISGDIFSLLQEMDGLSFTGAIEELAEIAGIQLQKQEEDEEYKKRKRLYEICDIASAWFRQNFLHLPEEHPAKQNLADRGLLNGIMPNGEVMDPESYSATTDPFIGFAPNRGLADILFQARYSKEEIITAGLMKVNEEDGKTTEVFRNRIVWTVTDVQGKPIGFSGRRIYDSSSAPKYLNSPQTPLYNKSKVLLNLGAAKPHILSSQEVYVVEGQTDVMALKAAGLMNVVATCGTAFGADHATTLLRLSAAGKDADKFKIIFCFDGDAAGIKAAQRVYEGVPAVQLNSYVVRLPESDPCDYRLNYGNDALVNLVTLKQVSLVEFILKEETQNWNLTTVEGRAQYIQKARTILKSITNPLQHSEYVRRVAFWTGTPYSELVNVLSSNGRAVQSDMQRHADKAITDTVEGKVIAGLLQYPEVAAPLWKQNSVSPAMFGVYSELAKSAYKMVTEGDIDFSAEHVGELAHTDLGYSDGEEEAGLQMTMKQFMQAAYLNEAASLTARVASASDDGTTLTDEALLEEILSNQNALRDRYGLKPRHRHKRK